MIALVLVLVLVIVCLVAWDRCVREKPPADSPAADVPTRERFRPTARAAPRPGPGKALGRPRFQGRGAAAGRPAAGVNRFVPRAEARPRFSGEVRRSPDAIGLACGRPIAECDRGADCLCVD